ncbi:hypothetical protein B0T11DRAFT_54143 [Plectosphaerella cucumerina]|uniref:Zn(2)-C6 fungal-type domain-containing protein n=1 Tax=Plectosphaerella cucumerina TaxID=40658 RepID=A0A8K0TJE1_9PEZI|nr:hypothetical protein B0T11DRAFT_54143 [Plectosphaerella cucumerina]
MAYRPIQPTVSRSVASDDDGRGHHLTAGTGSPDISRPPAPQGKRGRGSTHQVVQACPHCRQSKAKCDGARPRCGNCVAKNKACGYIGEEGQSRQAAMMTRLGNLENIIRFIRTQPLEDAERLFHQLRSKDGSKHFAKIASEGTSTDEADPDLYHASFSSVVTGASSSAGQDLDSVSVSQSPVFSGKASTTDGVSPSEPSPDKKDASGTETALPDRIIVGNAIEAFFASSLQPFHVFSREEVSHLFDSVYSRHKAHHQDHDEAAIACLAAVAAVGARYHRAKLSKNTSQTLYDVARYHLDKAIDSRPLDAIRCCVLLTMYNFMVKSTVALVYVEIGLNMARRQGLYARDPRDTTLTIQRWTEYRKAWRTLLCLSSWIPFTAGFNEDHDAPISRIPLAAIDIGPQVDDADILQSEMTKVSLLKADLLRARLALPLIDIATMQSANHDLQSWYSQIPEVMYLHRVAQPNYGEGVQACICYIHLLHLDAIILLARRATSQFVRTHGFGRSNELPWTNLDQALASQAARGVVAASHASRILALLGSLDRVHDIAWLIMNQLYACCILLFHSTAQKLLFQLPESKWSEDLEQATTCLSILETCGLTDPLAAQLHAQINDLYQQILGISSRFSPRPVILNSSTSWNEYAYLVTSPHGADPRLVQISTTLLNLVSKPFNKISESQPRVEGRPGSREVHEMNNWQRKKSITETGFASVGSSSRMPHSSLQQRLEDWNFESTLPFRVDSQRSTESPSSEAVTAQRENMATPPQAQGSNFVEGNKGSKRTKTGSH